MRVAAIIMYVLETIIQLLLAMFFLLIGTTLLKGVSIEETPIVGVMAASLFSSYTPTAIEALKIPFVVMGGVFAFAGLVALGGIIQIARKSPQVGVHIVAIILGVFQPWFLLGGIFGLIAARNFKRMGY